eukprot:6184864-Alexandrium_andersonii.AAC.1
MEQEGAPGTGCGPEDGSRGAGPATDSRARHQALDDPYAWSGESPSLWQLGYRYRPGVPIGPRAAAAPWREL